MLNNNNFIATIMSMFIFMIFVFTNNNKLNKKLNNLEKFNNNDITEDSIRSIAKEEINNTYHMDIEAIRNLGAIAKSIITSSIHDQEGEILLPGNVRIQGKLEIENTKNDDYALTLKNKRGGLKINGCTATHKNSIYIEKTGGRIFTWGQTADYGIHISSEGKPLYCGANTDNKSIVVPKSAGYIEIAAKADNKSIVVPKDAGYIEIAANTASKSILVPKDAGYIEIGANEDNKCINILGNAGYLSTLAKEDNIAIKIEEGAGMLSVAGKSDGDHGISILVHEKGGMVKLEGKTKNFTTLFITENGGKIYTNGKDSRKKGVDGATDDGYDYSIRVLNGGVGIHGKTTGGSALFISDEHAKINFSTVGNRTQISRKYIRCPTINTHELNTLNLGVAWDFQEGHHYHEKDSIYKLAWQTPGNKAENIQNSWILQRAEKKIYSDIFP